RLSPRVPHAFNSKYVLYTMRGKGKTPSGETVEEGEHDAPGQMPDVRQKIRSDRLDGKGFSLLQRTMPERRSGTLALGRVQGSGGNRTGGPRVAGRRGRGRTRLLHHGVTSIRQFGFRFD